MGIRWFPKGTRIQLLVKEALDSCNGRSPLLPTPKTKVCYGSIVGMCLKRKRFNDQYPDAS
ncbi:hypothetical protein CR513_01315, partial [Mucuna pruriens]